MVLGSHLLDSCHSSESTFAHSEGNYKAKPFDKGVSNRAYSALSLLLGVLFDRPPLFLFLWAGGAFKSKQDYKKSS